MAVAQPVPDQCGRVQTQNSVRLSLFQARAGATMLMVAEKYKDNDHSKHKEAYREYHFATVVWDITMPTGLTKTLLSSQ